MQTQARRIVTKIDANPILAKQNDENSLLRVAAYCRVSTDEESQQSSYELQVQHYTEYINKHDNWTLVGVYADEGIIYGEQKLKI